VNSEGGVIECKKRAENKDRTLMNAKGTDTGK
jgi:hypothetical protein